MNATKGYGISINEIDMSCPADMEPYVLAKQYEENQNDIKNWQLGSYICHAISTIGKGKYPKEPMFQIKEEKEVNNEALAVAEQKERTRLLAEKGLPQSPK